MEGSQFRNEDHRTPGDGMRKDEIFSKIVRAGTRTYYFDVRTIRENGRYITITESKRKIDESGNPFYARHKIFLYEEDFDKFMGGLSEAIEKAETLPYGVKQPAAADTSDDSLNDFNEVDFDELGKR